MAVEKKYPHLSNEQLMKLLDCCRIMNHKNYPDEFKHLEVPYGHDLIDAIKGRLLPQEVKSIIEVDLNFLFRNNHDLRTYFLAAIQELADNGTPITRPAEEMVEEILHRIQGSSLVAQSADFHFVLVIAADLTQHDYVLIPEVDGGVCDWRIIAKPPQSN
jgi:hypothetical protein